MQKSTYFMTSYVSYLDLIIHVGNTTYAQEN